MPRHPRLPSLEEAATGVFIDFESNVDQPPSVLGVLRVTGSESLFEQHVIEAALHPAAEAWSPASRSGGSCVASTPDGAIARVAYLAEGRMVFAYAAQHERELVEKITPDPPFRIVDILPWARRWRAFHGVRFERRPFEGGPNSLRNMADLAGLEFPPFLGRRRVGPNLARVREQLARHGGDWSSVPPGAKRAWSRVLEKNRWDCYSSRTLLARVVDDLAQ